MRRTPSRRLFAAALLVASVLAPTAVTPAAAVHTARVDRYDKVDRHDKGDPHSKDECPSGGLGRGVTARLDKAVADVRREAGIPGVAVGLWMPGKGCYVRATGVADTVTRRRMTTDQFMRIGSETKTFTVTALLELVDDHLIRLDDQISRYVRGVPNGARITLRHLAEMRSGLFPYSADSDFARALLSDPGRSFTPRELLAYGFRHPNTFAPGEEFQYSNTNLILLGLVVEKVGGRPLADFIRERVLHPARLRHTLFPEGREFPEPHAHGYTNQTLSGEIEDATDWNPSWAWAAGAMISDLHDLRRWARIVATGTLLSPQTQRERLRMLPTGFPGTSYGLGIFDSGGWIGHNGSIPGYQSVTVYLPSRKATLVLLLNTDVTHDGQEPSSLLARAITEIVTPDNVYDRPAPPR
ncbi:serine hydrolase domain-containing protein [Streptomyces europaeiscabiei]|uniref:serine hydrolase domain-containing protein n=1 Tax=Streptomyces europaeiscabiei TaxID=146819 RepID=UPI0029B9FAE5|nr:serine hydrolase domain-containing protein [Streptomyces europaeiscabiei]MDX3616269.1 serine hydrolase [Streptomyces europaeiscabiei]MDX3636424.1 serine hydrolase [Streptomyces europaeiscabiei]MDX3654481.1 serine hydrolase [Streptomyces europaeiscabiei]